MALFTERRVAENRSAIPASGDRRRKSTMAERVNPTVEEVFWRDNYRREPYFERGYTFDDYYPRTAPAGKAACAMRDLPTSSASASCSAITSATAATHSWSGRSAATRCAQGGIASSTPTHLSAVSRTRGQGRNYFDRGSASAEE